MKTLQKLSLIVLPALALTACSTVPRNDLSAFPQATAVEDVARMDLLLDPEADGLEWSQLGAFQAFVDHYRSNGHGPIILNYPQGSQDDHLAQVALSEIRVFLDSRGIPANYTEEGPYDATGAFEPPVIVTYRHYTAELPAECQGRRWDNLALELNNAAYSGFGCFMVANRAAMVGDPYHLIGPTDGGSGDAGRRQTVLDTYRRGEPTGTQRSDDESGAISTAID